MRNLYRKIRESEFDNGFIYPIFNIIVKLLIKINLVEVFKLISEYIIIRFYKDSNTELLNIKKRKARGFSIDFFILLKYLFILILWKYNISKVYLTIIVGYLLFMNVFTYFYYHIWDKSAILDQHLTVNRVRRRFVNLFISFLYMITVYGYLYDCVFNYCFNVEKNLTSINYFIFSLSNSFSHSYDKITAINNLGEVLILSQIVMTFLFIAIILVTSIPKANRD